MCCNLNAANWLCFWSHNPVLLFASSAGTPVALLGLRNWVCFAQFPRGLLLPGAAGTDGGAASQGVLTPHAGWLQSENSRPEGPRSPSGESAQGSTTHLASCWYLRFSGQRDPPIACCLPIRWPVA
jgi:hypothetical protein